MRILVIEDEPALREQLARRLGEEGWRVDVSGDGEEGLYLAREYPVDLAVVDLGLPRLSGLEVIRRLRADGRKLPILILTARGKWQEKVEGLEAGGDDYLVKPFVMEELLARVRALSRRAAGGASERLSLGPLVIELGAQQVSMDGAPVSLTAYEYQLLEYLARRAGEVIPKHELADYLYPHDEERDSNVIEVLMGRLRRKLDPEGRHQPIETLRGRGYRLAPGADGA